MIRLATGPLLDRAIAKIDARRAVTGPIETEYTARIETPDGRRWSITLTPSPPTE